MLILWMYYLAGIPYISRDILYSPSVELKLLLIRAAVVFVGKTVWLFRLRPCTRMW